MYKSAYLALDASAVDRRLARRFPPDLAWRFHALPVAEDGGRVTVVMADPGDAAARDAVVTALGPASCVVQGDPVTIDALLAEIWGNEVRRPLDLRVCAFPQSVTDEVWDYAQALGDLLGGRVSRLDTSEGMEALVEKGECAECDLIIFEEPDHRLIHRLLSRSATDSTPALRQSRVPFAVLAARQPRWPLKNILLVICGQGPDDAAVDWVLRLAQQSESAVTVLTVVPPVPAMYSQRARMDQGLPALLSTDTALGRQMRRVAHHLEERRIEGTLRLRQGAPDWQIRCEITKGNYDLIALAARPRQWWMRLLEGDLVCLLLRKADQPVLVAKPRTA